MITEHAKKTKMVAEAKINNLGSKSVALSPGQQARLLQVSVAGGGQRPSKTLFEPYSCISRTALQSNIR